jgi:hypothetical protein
MLYHHLKKMEIRPGLYGVQCVEDIFHFILAYTLAEKDNNISTADTGHFEGFGNFVNNHYKTLDAHHNWSILIRYHSGISHTESFKNFFTLFNEFVSEYQAT